MNLNLTPTICPTCTGFGVTTSDQGAITCMTCAGNGMWLQDDRGKRIAFTLPAIESTSSSNDLPYRKWLLYGSTGVSVGLSILSFGYLLTQHNFSLPQALWNPGAANITFGTAGLATFLLLPHLNRKETSQSSLEDLPQLLADATEAIDIRLFLNSKVIELFQHSAKVAESLHQPVVDETVLLITLLQQPRITGIIARMETSTDALIEYLSSTLPEPSLSKVSSVTFTPGVRQRIFAGLGEAISHDFPYLELEDLLLAYAGDQGGTYQEILNQEGITYKELYAVSRWYAGDQERARQWAFWLERGRSRPKGFMNKAWTALPTPFLDQYSQDITRLAANGHVPTVSVRQQEIQQILGVLGRTQKNNTLLVGEPGVGKNAIVGAIALRMIEENVPEILKDKRLVSMDMSALLSAGGSAEENMQTVIDEVNQAGNVILVIPDLHVLIGTSSGALDAAALLANALNRGYLQVLSTATYSDYHRYIESNPTFAALLEVIEIKEVSLTQAIEILEEEAPQIEGRQHVFLTYPAIESAAVLAKKYFPDRVLPDSAISLLDEAASATVLSGQKWVQKEDVEIMVEKKTNIPVRSADEKEATLLMNLEENLHKRIVGQEEAVQAVALSLRRARAGLQDGKRPISSFLFVGPTGVGKTETAKALAATYFGSEQAMVRLDMSEYQDNTSIYRLIGAPAGSGSNDPGTLTTAVREHPFSLILLDELEKAHPDVLNLFLQLLDDGRLTESSGRTVYFTNCIIIATSNAGSSEIIQLLQQGIPVDQLPKQVLRLLQSYFKPEFLNRFDAIIPFHALKPAEIEEIVHLMLKQVIDKMASQQYTLSFTDEAVSKIAKLGFDPIYGARPLRRLIQDKIEGLLAGYIIGGTIKPGETLQITAEMIQ